MSSAKVVIRKKANNEGLYPVAIRITKNRKSSYLYTGQYVELKHWDTTNHRIKKSHPNSSRLNNLILARMSEANDKLLELETNEKRVSSSTVKKRLNKEYINSSFFSLASQYLDSLETSGKYSRLSADKPRVKHFKEFLKGKDIDFRDITVLTIKNFQSWLRQERKVNERTIANHLIVIRTIYNLAIKEEIVDRKHYPFGKDKIVIKFPDSLKIGLETSEVQKLENLQLENQAQQHALNVWLFTFYLAGMRVSDALRLKWSDFQNGRLFYSMGKNNKGGSLKMPEKAEKILLNYRLLKEKDSDTVFPELRNVDFMNKKDVYKRINNAVKKFNKHLIEVAKKAKITKPITMHISRHTFGNISGENIPIQMLQKLYRHTSITTTINYQANFAFKDTDEALESVIGF